MAMDTAPPSQVLDILFDEDNGVLSKELSLDGKSKVETLSFNDLDLLSDDLLDFFNKDAALAGDIFEDICIKPAQSQQTKTQAHTDHDYYAQCSPGQHSDSGVSLNSGEQEDTYLSSMAAMDDGTDFCGGPRVLMSSPEQSRSPMSDTNSDSSPLSYEDFDFSTCMDLSEMDSAESTVDLGVFSSSAFSGSKDTDVSIDFDFSKGSEVTKGSGGQPLVQTLKTINGNQAIILVDPHTRQTLQVQRLTSRNSSDSDSLPFTMKDIVGDDLLSSADGKFPELRLTDEEKELLAREGVSLPTNMPLTKEEERSLKAVRRKIRNKISAKESRKRKQGYVDGLERRVKICTQENQQLQKKVQNLEKQNVSLVVQLNKLKTMVAAKSKLPAQASTCVMVLLLSFALLVIPNISPFGSDVKSPLSADAGVRGNSRSLLGKEEQQGPKVSMFSEVNAPDADPYGVSAKQGLPWQEANPSTTYSAKKERPLVPTEEAKKNEATDNKVVAVDGVEGNDTTEEEVVGRSVEAGDDDDAAAVKNDLLFESELNHAGEDPHPPPAKKARLNGDEEDL